MHIIRMLYVSRVSRCTCPQVVSHGPTRFESENCIIFRIINFPVKFARSVLLHSCRVFRIIFSLVFTAFDSSLQELASYLSAAPPVYHQPLLDLANIYIYI